MKKLFISFFLLTIVAFSSDEVWRPFNSDSPWNTPISRDEKIDPLSDTYINYINKHFSEKTFFGGESPLKANMDEWSIPVYFVDSSIAKIAVTPHNDWGEGNQIPIPKNALPSSAADKSLCIVNKNTNETWGIWELKGSYPNYTAGNSSKTDLSGDGVTPNGAREGGFPLIAGLIRPEEIEAGEIKHALVFSFDARDGFDQFIYPATRGADFDSTTSKEAPPMGTRLQLKPDFDISGYPRGARIVLEALKKYGMYLGDENDSKSMSLYFQSNVDWKDIFDDRDKEALKRVKASDFQVINFKQKNCD